MSEFALSAQGLKKTYKAAGNAPAKEALKGIDLNVPRGSIFGLLGPNGAGKSTFINVLAGMVMKTEGTASIWGFDIDENPRQSRASIGIVPQELSIDPFFTPGEIMRSVLTIKWTLMRGRFLAVCGGVYWSPKPSCIIRPFWFSTSQRQASTLSCVASSGIMSKS
jgi:ABC-type sugar transport system ATPase subunit